MRELLGGGLKPNEPRRFLLEAMIGAMHADGAVDARETAVLEHHLAQHPLFYGLGTAAARTLISIATDAIKFSGTAAGRAPAIAKGLPARIHRLAAYAMAAEVAIADQSLHAGELAFLEALRGSLRISPREAEEIMGVAAAGRIGKYLEEIYVRIKSLVPHACELFALRALMRNTATDEHLLRIRALFEAVPDLQLPTTEIDGELLRAFRRPRSPTAQTLDELAIVATRVPEYVDRYWLIVYALVAEAPAKVPQWRVRPFVRVVQAAFAITDADMELAAVDALMFPASLPRP
ncbi:MAG: TerB family tellurite resistance protein [Kofleriaceae bacterium]